jgi:hypothetical protein
VSEDGDQHAAAAAVVDPRVEERDSNGAEEQDRSEVLGGEEDERHVPKHDERGEDQRRLER